MSNGTSIPFIKIEDLKIQIFDDLSTEPITKFQPHKDAHDNHVHKENPTEVSPTLLHEMSIKLIVSLENLQLKFRKKLSRQFMFTDSIYISVANVQEVQELPVQSEISDKKEIIIDNEVKTSVLLARFLTGIVRKLKVQHTDSYKDLTMIASTIHSEDILWDSYIKSKVLFITSITRSSSNLQSSKIDSRKKSNSPSIAFALVQI